jgi:transposase-like protein
MPKSDPIKKLNEIANLSVLKEKLTLQELHKRVVRVTNLKKTRSSEQKIIALKILILNEMRYEQTAKEVGVTRKTLWAWWKQYGEMMEVSKPSEEIAQAIENDMASLMFDVYASARKTIKKLDTLVDKTDNAKQIYPVVEALRATTEFIKIDMEKNKNGGGQVQGTDFFMNIYNTMINNLDNGNTDQS